MIEIKVMVILISLEISEGIGEEAMQAVIGLHTKDIIMPMAGGTFCNISYLTDVKT